jgi:hypothetical protein
MATAQRVFWETVIFLGFVGLLILVWIGSRVVSSRQADRLTLQHEVAASQREEEHRLELETLNQEWEARSEEHAKSEALAVFRAFEAGIRGAVPARWGRFLRGAASELLKFPAVAFVHLSTPGGRVIVSSDEEYSAVGRFDERAEWALSVAGLESRRGGEAGILEVAAPIRDQGQVVAFLWLGYDLDRVREEIRDRGSS